MTDTTRLCLLLTSILLATACTPSPKASAIHDIQFVNAPVGTSGVPEIAAGTQLDIKVTGDGECRPLMFNWGEDSLWIPHSPTIPDPTYNLSSPSLLSHTYSNMELRGFRRITVAGDGSTCIGEVQKRILITPEVLSIGWALNQDACGPLPRAQNVMKNVELKFDIPPRDPASTSPVGSIEVRPGWIFDANGSTDLADASFPFPGFQKYSVLVVLDGPDPQVSGKVIQGGTQFLVRTIQDASRIKMCYNSDVLPGGVSGSQGFQINFRVDASNASSLPQ